MCGFVAVWDRSGREAPERLRDNIQRMTTTLAHRGPDAQGTHLLAERGLALGHRRLAILDTSPEGNQPMMSPSGRYWLAYNGETYNFPDLRARLEQDGASIRWRGTSDTEVLLACFDVWGVLTTMKRTHGMCAFACYDVQEDVMWLVRDRLGQKPLYWTDDSGCVRAASELRALRAHPDHTDVFDPVSVSGYLHTGVVGQPRSILQHVEQVLPGHALRFSRGGDVDILRWWDPSEANERFADRTAAVDAVESALIASVSRRTASDVPLGALLSGGVDSTLMVALLAHTTSEKLRTFTVAVDDAQHDESEHARAISKHLGTQHTELRVTAADMLEATPTMAIVYDEPFSDSSQIPTWLVCKLTRQHVTVAISGDGGDELFGGYDRYTRIARRWQRMHAFPTSIRRLVGHSIREVGTVGWPHTRIGDIGRQLASPSLLTLYRNAMCILPNAARFVQAPVPPARRAPTTHTHPVGQMMREDLNNYLLNDILVKTDRASMSVGLELRSPMLDHRVAELALSIPPDWTWDRKGGKQILRHILEKHVPSPLWDRPKQGFSIPLTRWVRGPLAEWMEEALSPARLADTGLWNVARIRSFWRDHQRERHHHTSGLWAIAQFESWRRQGL